MGNYEVKNRQFNASVLAVLTVDGSSVGASFGADGLDNGQHIATIKKAGAVFTIRLRKTFGMTPQVLIQEQTLDCQARVTSSDKKDIEITTYTLAGGAGAGTEDFTVWLFGTEGITEGGR